MITRKLRHLSYLISTRLIQSSIKHSFNINLIANRQITLSIGAFSSNQYSSFDPNIFISSICGELTPKATPDQWATKLSDNADRLAHRIHAASQPRYLRLFQTIGNIDGGVKFISDMRADVLELLSEKSECDEALRRFEQTAKELLTLWFCMSNMHLERLTWQSPSDLVQKAAEYEAVHPVQGLVDFRRRVGPHRRCFVFTHAAMAREPLVIVHVALMNRIADSIQDIVKRESLDDHDETDDNTANYYSITSTQKGLKGIDLGNMLIKRVVRELQHDAPHIVTHSTISPMPGFRNWLSKHLQSPMQRDDIEIMTSPIIDRIASLFDIRASDKPAVIDRLRAEIASNDWQRYDQLRNLLMHFCARYLCTVRRHNGFAYDPVANFHLHNGAQVYRINWRGDTSIRGVRTSLGIMVNYRYVLADVERNSARYINDQTINAGELVQSLLEVPPVD